MVSVNHETVAKISCRENLLHIIYSKVLGKI